MNSKINRIQVRGTYSITKQKFLNQGKIAALKVMPYRDKYNFIMKQYLSAFKIYYKSVSKIQGIIDVFNTNFKLPYSDSPQFKFVVKPSRLNKKCLHLTFIVKM